MSARIEKKKSELWRSPMARLRGRRPPRMRYASPPQARPWRQNLGPGGFPGTKHDCGYEHPAPRQLQMAEAVGTTTVLRRTITRLLEAGNGHGEKLGVYLPAGDLPSGGGLRRV